MDDKPKLMHSEMDLFMMPTEEEKDAYCIEHFGMTFAETCKDWDENPKYKLPLLEQIRIAEQNEVAKNNSTR